MKNTEAILVTPGKIKIQDAPVPELKDEEVLLKVEYVGICGSDIHGFECGPFIPPEDPRQKIGLGHECAGTVVRVGARVKRIRVGDKVNIEPGVPCGKCQYCLTGHYNLCPHMDFMATYPNYKGALANYVAHPEAFTYRLPPHMTTMEGALVEPAAVGMHAAELGKAAPGKKIIILGAGCIGLMTLQACRMMGASEIVVVDVLDRRLAMAKKLGAMETVNGRAEDTVPRCQEILGNQGADIVFETAGNPFTAEQTQFLVARGGKIMIVGTVPGETPMNFLRINREVTVQTVFRYANNYPMTIEAISSGGFDVKSMVTDIYDYQETQRAFEESISRRAEIIKGMIHISADT